MMSTDEIEREREVNTYNQEREKDIHTVRRETESEGEREKYSQKMSGTLCKSIRGRERDRNRNAREKYIQSEERSA